MKTGNLFRKNSSLLNEQEVDAKLASKQDILVSGTNIKTINGNSILGTGDIDVASVKNFDTLEDLKSDTNLKIGDAIQTLGYYSANDGGGAKYYIEAKNDNVYQEKINDTLYATLVLTNPINISQFGAHGDGITDDSDAIQKAIDYALSLNIDDYGYLTKVVGGNYFITKPITITSKSQFDRWNIEIQGLKGDFADYMIKLKGQISSCILNVGVIRNNTGGGIECISDELGVTWMGTTKIISNFIFAGPSFDGIHFETVKDNLTSWINDNDIMVQRFGQGRYGFYAIDCHQLVFHHPDFEYGACYLDTCQGAMFIAPHMSDPVSTEYIIETVGDCNNFLIIGGSNSSMSWEDYAETKMKISSGTNGGVISYQTAYGLEVSKINVSPFINIVGGKLIRTNPYLVEVNTAKEIYDTRLLTSLQCPTRFICNAVTTDIILDERTYGGLSKINEIIIDTANTPINIKVGDKVLKAFTDPTAYKKYKINWYYGNRWEMQELIVENLQTT